MKKVIKLAILCGLFSSAFALENHIGSVPKSNPTFPSYPIQVMIINDTHMTLYVTDYSGSKTGNFTMGPGWQNVMLLSDNQWFHYAIGEHSTDRSWRAGCSENSNGYTLASEGLDPAYTIKFECDPGMRREMIRFTHK